MIFPPKLATVYALGKNSDKQATVATLQSLGVLHLTEADYQNQHLTTDSSLKGIEGISQALLKLRFIAEQTQTSLNYTLTELPELTQTLTKANGFINTHLPSVQTLVERRGELTKKKERLEAEIEVLTTLPVDVDMRKSTRTETRVYASKKPHLVKVAHGRVVHHAAGKDHFYIISAPKKTIQHFDEEYNQLKRIDLSFVPASTQEYLLSTQENLTKTEEDILRTTDQLNHILDEEESTLRALHAAILNYYNQFTATNSFQKSAHFFVLKGYCEQEHVEIIQQALPNIIITSQEADKNAPTKLRNNPVAGKFQSITQLFSTPQTGAADPTAFVSLFFPFFFGFMLSDIGYGILLFILILVLRERLRGDARKALPILTYCAASTILFGMLFGSFFGGLIKIPAILADPFANAQGILIASLVIGLIHMNLGVIIGIVQAAKQGKSLGEIIVQHSAFPILQIAIAIGILVHTYLGLAIALLAVVILVKRGGVLGILDVSGYLGTWFSYARLLALSLATAGVALAVNVIADKALGFGAIGVILWLLIIIVGHLFNFIINLVGTSINAARLHYVEFFGLFFEGGGITFTPFHLQQETGGM